MIELNDENNRTISNAIDGLHGWIANKLMSPVQSALGMHPAQLTAIEADLSNLQVRFQMRISLDEINARLPRPEIYCVLLAFVPSLNHDQIGSTLCRTQRGLNMFVTQF